MATCRDIITRAYQMSGIYGVGEAPDAASMTAGLGVLQSIYDRIVDNRSWTPVVGSGTVVAEEGQRITGASAVTLPTSLVDDVTGEDRPPHDIAMVQYDTGAGFVTYASDRGEWVALDGLTESDEAPFSGRNKEGLSALVAVEMAETYPGAAVGPVTIGKARRWQSMWSRQQPIDTEYY